MRAALAAVLLVFFPAAVSADGGWRTVYLNEPGALEWLKAENPRHYRKIRFVMDAFRPEENPLQVVEARAGGLSVSGALLTSYPPKRSYSIQLDGTVYRGRATLSLGYERVPVKR